MGCRVQKTKNKYSERKEKYQRKKKNEERERNSIICMYVCKPLPSFFFSYNYLAQHLYLPESVICISPVTGREMKWKLSKKSNKSEANRPTKIKKKTLDN